MWRWRKGWAGGKEEGKIDGGRFSLNTRDGGSRKVGTWVQRRSKGARAWAGVAISPSAPDLVCSLLARACAPAILLRVVRRAWGGACPKRARGIEGSHTRRGALMQAPLRRTNSEPQPLPGIHTKIGWQVPSGTRAVLARGEVTFGHLGIRPQDSQSPDIDFRGLRYDRAGGRGQDEGGAKWIQATVIMPYQSLCPSPARTTASPAGDRPKSNE